MSDQTKKKGHSAAEVLREVADFLDKYEKWYDETQGNMSTADEGGSPTPPPPPPPGSGFGGH